MSTKTPKLEDPEWGKQIAVCLGMLVMVGAAPFVFNMHGGGDGQSPLDHLIHFATTAKTAVTAWAPVALYALAGITGVVGVVLLAARQARMLLHASMRAWWIYRRRWASVLDEHGLVVKHGKHVRVPKLGKVRTLNAMDVMQVHMPQGQDLDDWQEAAQPLALAFGASVGFVQPDTTRNPYKDIVVAFARGKDGHTVPHMLPSARDLAIAPAIPGYTPRPVTIRVSARALILGWGSMRIDDGETIRSVRIWGRRWNQCLIVPAT